MTCACVLYNCIDGGNKGQTYVPTKICNGAEGMPSDYNGGFGCPEDFEGKNFGSGNAIECAIPIYARASPIMDEVRGALDFGMNTFRLPFRIEYIYELWKGEPALQWQLQQFVVLVDQYARSVG